MANLTRNRGGYFFTMADRRHIASRYRKGDAMRAIAADYGCSCEPIRKVLVGQGVQVRQRGAVEFRGSRGRNKEMVRLRKSGHNAAAIGRLFGMTRQRVSQILRAGTA